jgi:tetratricopeptide (TPR) repeat protein
MLCVAYLLSDSAAGAGIDGSRMASDRSEGTDRAVERLPDLGQLTAFDAALREVPLDQGPLGTAATLASGLIAEARAAGDDQALLRVLGYYGNACRVLGRHDEAIRALAEAVALAESLGDERGAIANSLRLGEARKYRGDAEEAEAIFRAVLERIRGGGHGVAAYEDFALQHLGKCLMDQGDAEATGYLDQALALRRAKGDASLIDSTERALTLARNRRRNLSDVE